MTPEFRLALATAAVALSGTASAAEDYVVTPSPGKLPVAKPPEIVVSLAPGALAEATRRDVQRMCCIDRLNPLS